MSDANDQIKQPKEPYNGSDKMIGYNNGYKTGYADGYNDGKSDVLDKLLAEVKALSNSNPSYWHSGDMVDRDDVLDIIYTLRKPIDRKEVTNG